MSEPHTLEAGASDPIRLMQIAQATMALACLATKEIEPRAKMQEAEAAIYDVLTAAGGKIDPSAAALASSAGPVPDEVRRLSEAATPGELNVSVFADGWRHTICAGPTWRVIARFEREEDAEFFAAAGRLVREGAHTLVEKADASASKGGVAPEGWRLVPYEPTEEMIEAAECGRDCSGNILDEMASTYRAMLAAAPTPSGRPDTPSAGGGKDPWAALRKIAELRLSEAGEPFDDALDIADKALAAAPEPAAGGGREIANFSPTYDPASEVAARIMGLPWAMAGAADAEIADQRYAEAQAIAADVIKAIADPAITAPAHGSAGGDGWQPIETAPRAHNVQVLGWGRFETHQGAPFCAIMQWFEAGGDFNGRRGWWTVAALAFEPTHFQPVPAPPTPATSSTPAEGK